MEEMVELEEEQAVEAMVEVEEEQAVGDIIVVDEEQEVGMTVTPFIKKLWNMVNDRNDEDIISWNSTGDSFIIHDQLQLTTKLLPRYFKHNTLASFVRQLNFYNFHKVLNFEGQIQYAHSCFIKGVPNILVFIKRKPPVTHKPSSSTNVNEGQVANLLHDLKEIKRKHSQVDKEMSLLRMDNSALWSELNSLRMKYVKQSSLINELIQFLVRFIHSHQTSCSKQNARVPRDVNPNKLKSGPTLLELDYINPKGGLKKSKAESYSGSPDVDNNKQTKYSVSQPGSSKAITYSLNIPESQLKSNGKTILSRESTLPKKNSQSLKQILAMNEPRYQTGKYPKKNPQGGGITYSVKIPRNQSRKIAQPDIQKLLHEILEENAKLSDENASEEMLTGIQTNNFELIERENHQVSMNQPIVQSPPAEDSFSVNTDSVTPEKSYVVEYPDNSAVNSSKKTVEVDLANLKSARVSPLGKRSHSNVSKTSNNSTNNFKPETSYSNSTKIQVYGDSQCRPKKSKNNSTTDSSTSFIELPENPSVELDQPEIQNYVVNFFQENGTLPSDIPLENMFSIIQSVDNHISEPGITKEIDPIESQLGKTYPVTESPPNDYSLVEVSENSITGFPHIQLEPIIQNPADKTFNSSDMPNSLMKYNILENPKQNLSLYLDNTQEELNALQEILTTLNSSDFGEILGNVDPDRGLEAISLTEENNENRTDDIVNEKSILIDESSNDYNLASTPNIPLEEILSSHYMNNDK